MGKAACPYCNSREVGQVRELTSSCVFRCKECGLGFQFPPPSHKEIRKYYTESVYPEVWGKHRGPFREMKKLTYKWVFRHLPKGEEKELLDIGTGYGFFLVEAKRHGYKPIGIEPSVQLAEIAQEESGAEVINEFFEDIEFNPHTFDVVSLLDTLEHTESPWTVLRKAASLVKPGGYLVMTTPDYGSFSARILGKFWFHLKDEHYFYFLGKFLERSLVSEGFRIVKLIPQKRPLTLAYLENHFRIYSIPILSPILYRLVSLLPVRLKNKVLSIYDGNLFLIAQKDSLSPRAY